MNKRTMKVNQTKKNLGVKRLHKTKKKKRMRKVTKKVKQSLLMLLPVPTSERDVVEKPTKHPS